MSADLPVSVPTASSVLFELLTESSPGLLPRLLQPLARRNLVPERFAARREGEALAVEIGLTGVPGETLSLIEGSLRQVVGVRSFCSRA